MLAKMTKTNDVTSLMVDKKEENIDIRVTLVIITVSKSHLFS